MLKGTLHEVRKAKLSVEIQQKNVSGNDSSGDKIILLRQISVNTLQRGRVYACVCLPRETAVCVSSKKEK